MDLNDQRDSKGHISFTSFKIWNILDKIFVLTHVHSHALSAIQQLQLYAIVFRNLLASNQISAVKEATNNPLIGDEDSFGPRSSRLYLAVWWERTICPARIRTDPARTSTTGARRCANGCDTPFRDRHPECYDRSHKSCTSAVEFDMKIRTFMSSI